MQTSFCLFLCLAVSGCSGILPQREEPIVSCTAPADCTTSAPACQGSDCACTAHSGCASRICDLYGDLGAGGKCVLESKIIYVDSAGIDGPSCKLSTGSQSLPWCELQLALDQLKLKPGMIISLLPSGSTYLIPPIDQSAGAVVLVGPGVQTVGKAATLGTSSMDGRLAIGNSANLLIDGVGINVDGIEAATGAKVTIRRSVIGYMQQQASFEGGTVTFDRNLFTQNHLKLIFNSATVSLTNNIITGNTVDASNNLIEFYAASGVFQFNTVAYNTVSTPGSLALNCGKSAGLMVKNSIFLQKGGAQQIATGCPTIASSLIVGKSDPTSGQLQQDPTFEDPASFDLRLRKGDATNTQYLFDKAIQVNPASEKNVDHDYYGTPRPQGTGYDIGAFELAVR